MMTTRFAAIDWKQMPDGKEKYAAYLCSREWSLLKQLVRDRCRGICERCGINAMDHVHHLTYARKYHESLTDLQACCVRCHEFTHGKSDYDPAKMRPIVIPWCGRSVKTFYLAGKISGTHWRNAVVPGWSEVAQAHDDAWCAYDELGLWGTVYDACTVLGVNLHYVGPWWRDLFGGHGSPYDNGHPHGYLLIKDDVECRNGNTKTAEARRSVARAVHSAVESADLLFAWIDSTDCYGTIYELGLAHSLGKVVVVGMPEAFSKTAGAGEMWLSVSRAYTAFGDTFGQAWDEFWNLVDFQSSRSIET